MTNSGPTNLPSAGQMSFSASYTFKIISKIRSQSIKDLSSLKPLKRLMAACVCMLIKPGITT